MSLPLISDEVRRSLPPKDLKERYQDLEEPIWAELHSPRVPFGSRQLWDVFRTFLRPISRERQEMNLQRWKALPAHLQIPSQTLGRSHHSCGATFGILERCNFACTSCYLSREANATAPLKPKEVRRQLDRLRAFLGPQGKAQITAGEVTLLPRAVLGSYVRYAISIGLDPMLMTHGERLLADPSYLRDLVIKDGLRKISIHVDVTQRGRRGWRPDISEEELHGLRSEYADLIRRIRAETGCRLVAAHTVTVNRENVHHVPSIVRWVARNADAFRMVSFQPVAMVGRTQDRAEKTLTMERMWSSICEGLDARLNPRAMLFGHPECNIVAPMLVVSSGQRLSVVETAREGHAWDRSFLRRLLEAIGGFSTIGLNRFQQLAGIAGLVVRNIPLVIEAPFYGAHRLWGLRREALGIVLGLFRGKNLRIRPLALVVHKFMNPDELETDLGKERLHACVFNVPVGEEMIPMCQLNATELRSKLTRARLREGSRAPGIR